PNSYHGVEIGMTLAQVKATGATVIKIEADQGGCTLVRSQGSTAPAGEPDVTLSPSGRVSDLAADGTSAVTPDGIRLGSSKADVLKAWPKAQHTPDFWVAPVPGNAKAQYLFDFDTAHGTLAGLLLTSTDRDDCAN
ncbi:MAG: hypothetical protein J2O46_09890, partial [Nocardioides sp.]|nr:hypothetical protein [Nocardioides sp.]